MPAGGLIAAGAIAAGTLIYSGIKEHQAKKAQAALLANRPVYHTPQAEGDIQRLAESQASQGMSGASRQALQNNTDRGFATGANAILMGGGDANAIGNLAEKSQEGSDQNAIYDDQRRLANLNNLQQAYTRASANADKAWNLNQYQPWANQSAAAAQQTQYYQNMTMQGIGMLGSVAGAAAGGIGGGGGAGGGARMAGGGGGIGGGGYIDSLPTDGPSMMPTPMTPQAPMSTMPMSYFGG